MFGASSYSLCLSMPLLRLAPKVNFLRKSQDKSSKSQVMTWLFWKILKSQSHDFDFFGNLKKSQVMTLTWLDLVTCRASLPLLPMLLCCLLLINFYFRMKFLKWWWKKNIFFLFFGMTKLLWTRILMPRSKI
jgi:hypothetical protein